MREREERRGRPGGGLDGGRYGWMMGGWNTLWEEQRGERRGGGHGFYFFPVPS